jgi:hypothetical protein
MALFSKIVATVIVPLMILSFYVESKYRKYYQALSSALVILWLSIHFSAVYAGAVLAVMSAILIIRFGNGSSRKGFWRLHLSTAIVVMFTTSVLMYFLVDTYKIRKSLSGMFGANSNPFVEQAILSSIFITLLTLLLEQRIRRIEHQRNSSDSPADSSKL